MGDDMSAALAAIGKVGRRGTRSSGDDFMARGENVNLPGSPRREQRIWAHHVTALLSPIPHRQFTCVGDGGGGAANLWVSAPTLPAGTIPSAYTTLSVKTRGGVCPAAWPQTKAPTDVVQIMVCGI
jgi:hypothetical protein